MSMYGRELTRRMYAASLASLDCVEQIVKEEAIDCHFSRCGHLEVACKQKHFDNYERQAEIIEVEFNHKLRVVRRSELSAEIGSSVYFGGMVDEVSAGCNPARYVAGLAGAAMKAGAEIYEHARVNAIERESRQGEAGWKIQTSRGALWAHGIERVRKFPDFILREDIDLESQISCSETFRASFQGLHRPSYHLPHKEPTQDCDQQKGAAGVDDHPTAAFGELHVCFREREVRVENTENLLFCRMRVTACIRARCLILDGSDDAENPDSSGISINAEAVGPVQPR